jgi:acyl dehydratase
MDTLYFEDFEPGHRMELPGRYTFDRGEMLAFARQFDPQPFHLDEEAAGRSIYGGLIASGFHTVSACFKLAVDGLIHRVASMGSPGVDEIRWLMPVRAGDTIAVTLEVVSVRPSQSRPDRGIVDTRYEVRNQRDELVMTMRAMGMFRRRPDPAAS